MIEFDEYYAIAVDEVALIGTSETAGVTHPYTLSVTLKNGKTVSVNFASKQARDTERRRMLIQISHEKRQNNEQLYNKLLLLEYAVNRIDKRQLRIWRILSKLLPVKEEDVKGGEAP